MMVEVMAANFAHAMTALPSWQALWRSDDQKQYFSQTIFHQIWIKSELSLVERAMDLPGYCGHMDTKPLLINFNPSMDK